ncbi:hypothetical protein MKZ38_008420 [Zalerion maritima]|uniref:Cytochrome P450 n=1 Tax=Zalerion maritima TaxID=339359 RepID=A0AAD5WNM1_9PEZI|nr:hypothetical protein MKZ38_008420 [Zalerion maritima]
MAFSAGLLISGFAVGVGLFILYAGGMVVYRLFFHPLAKYPGPRLAATSELWYAKHWTSGKYHKAIQAAHRKYGEVVRIAPNDLSFSTPQSFKDIYGHAVKGKKHFPKSDFFDTVGDHPGIVSVRNSGEHARQRKYLSHAFSAKALRDQEGIMLQYVDQFIRKIGEMGKPGGKGVDLEEGFVWLTFDIIGDLTFGEPFGAVAEGRTTFWISLLLDGVYVNNLVSWRRRLPIMNLALPFVLSKGMAEKWEKHNELTRRKMLKRLEDGDPLHRMDFFSHLLRKGGGDVPEPELLNQATGLIVGGSETTATCLTGLVWLLLRNEKALENLEREVRAAFQNESDITGDAASKLEYLGAVIEEGLRLFPPAGFGLQRVSPGANVDGHYAPPGTIVSTDPFVTAHDPKYWREVDKFIPERWIGDGLQGDVREASQPFSVGPRSCIGINLAYLEIRIILAKMVWAYDWELVDKELEFFEQTEMYLLWKKPSMFVRFHPKQG